MINVIVDNDTYGSSSTKNGIIYAKIEFHGYQCNINYYNKLYHIKNALRFRGIYTLKTVFSFSGPSSASVCPIMPP
jgi:hypothetical protein